MPSPPADAFATSEAKRPWLRTLLAMGTLLVALAAGVWIAVDIRGRALWRQHLVELEGAGWSRDLERYHTPVVEGTFWADPFVREMAENQGSDFDSRFKDALSKDPRFHSTVPLEVDLSPLWRRNSFVSKLPLDEIQVDTTLSRTEAADGLMEALRSLDQDLARFREALALDPSSPNLDPWNADFELSAFDDRPIFAALNVIDSYYGVVTLRSLCLLELGESSEALSEIEGALLAARHIRHDSPFLFHDHFIRGGRGFLQVVWEGLESFRWEERQLDRIDRLLSEEIETHPEFEKALRFQSVWCLVLAEKLGRAWGNRSYWDFVSYGRSYRSRCFGGGAERFLHEIGLIYSIDEFLWNTLPPGAFFAAGVEVDTRVSRTLTHFEMPLRERLASFRAEFEESRRPWFTNPVVEPFSIEGYPAYWLAEQEDIHAFLHIARAAVAAERHRLDSGRYPTAWAEFVPRWLDSIPEDPWSGGSLLYRLDGEGRPVIYSVDRNGLDEGGVPERRRGDGDLVWRYSAAE